MKQSRSHKQIARSLKRRWNHVMVNVLSRFEDTFPDMDDSPDGKRYKGLIKTMFNESMRATSDELNDYDIDFRPLRVTDEAITMTRTFMETVEKIEFTDDDSIPSIKIHSSTEKGRVLDAIRAELEAGIVYEHSAGQLVLVICGMNDCIKVLPAMDRYRMMGAVRQRYADWRNQLISLYKGE